MATLLPSGLFSDPRIPWKHASEISHTSFDYLIVRIPLPPSRRTLPFPVETLLLSASDIVLRRSWRSGGGARSSSMNLGMTTRTKLNWTARNIFVTTLVFACRGVMWVRVRRSDVQCVLSWLQWRHGTPCAYTLEHRRRCVVESAFYPLRVVLSCHG